MSSFSFFLSIYFMNQPYGCWYAFLPVSHCTGGWAGRNTSSLSQEKHWEAQNQPWLLCMSQLFYSFLRGKKKKKSCLHLIFAGASETKPHLQEALMALRALTALPRHSALRWHIPGSSPLPASTSLRTAAGTTAKEELSLQTAFTKQSLLHCSQL